MLQLSRSQVAKYAVDQTSGLVRTERFTPMTPTFLQYVSALLAIGIGLNGLFRPESMGKAVGLAYTNEVGRTELRVLFGSFLVALPVSAIYTGRSEFFEFFGIAALAAAVIKTVSAVLTKDLFADIRVGIAVDVVLALCLLSSVFV